MGERIKIGFSILVATAWAISMTLSWINPDRYKPDPTLNVAFTAVLGISLVPTVMKDKEPK